MYTQNLQILREDTLGATCSAAPFVYFRFIHILFPQNISWYRLGETYLINSPQNFSWHAPVTRRTYTLIRYVDTALWQIRPVKVHLRAPLLLLPAKEVCSDSLKGFRSKPTPPDTWPGFAY